MATRTRAPLVHAYIDDPTTPGTCRECHITDPRRTNRVHQLPDMTDAAAEHQRRAGESETDQ